MSVSVLSDALLWIHPYTTLRVNADRFGAMRVNVLSDSSLCFHPHLIPPPPFYAFVRLDQIRPKAFAMLPEPLTRERDRVECMTFMGILPEIDHAWMTVDNVLFLWNYHTQDFTQFRELDQVGE